MFLITRHDFFSQIIGFLILENGITGFGAVAVGGLPLIVVMGISFTVILGALLMVLIGKEIRTVYATEDTDRLRELIE